MHAPFRTMAILTFISISSCAGLMGRSDNETISALQSELSILKKRVAMVERTNGVVESENRAHKLEIRRLKGEYEALQRQSESKIRELGELNAKLRNELAETATRLGDETKKTAELAGRLTQTVQEYDRKISALSASLARVESENRRHSHENTRKIFRRAFAVHAYPGALRPAFSREKIGP